MVSILDYIAEQKSKAVFVKDKDNAWDQFVSQKQAIEAISGTNGFKELVDYRAREKAACEKRLSTMKSEDIKAVQAELAQATRFLDFLHNILSADIDLSSN